MVVAVERVNDSVLMDKGGVGMGSLSGRPLGSPAGEGTFPSNGLAVCSRLHMVEEGMGGDAAGSKGLELGCGVSGVIKNSQGPCCGEANGRVAVDKGGEG